MRRRLALVCLALLVILITGLLVVHAPPVRSHVLRLAVRAARSQGIQLEAARLDYNLATRRVRLANVRVSAVDDAQPFFTADDVSVVVPPRVFLGEVAVDLVSITRGLVHIVRRADGTTNLPQSSGSGTGEPAPLPIARVSAPALTVEYRDEPADIAIRAPALTVDLSSRGRLAIEAPVSVRVASTSTQLDVLSSDVAFDGRDLVLSNLRLDAPELRGRMEGTLALIRREPSVDLRISGDSDLERAAKWWGQEDEAPRGSVHVEGTVSGPLGEPAASLNVSSNGVSWQRLDVANISGQVRLSRQSAEVNQAQAAVAGGQVHAAGSLVWQEPSQARVEASWRDVDAAQIVGALTDARVSPSGRASGELTASGTLDSIAGWDVDARVALTGGQRGRGRLPVPGESRFRLSAGQWGLDARHVVGDVTEVDASLTGRLRGSDFANSAIAGTLQASESDFRTLLQMLAEAELLTVDQDLVTGSIRANARLEGSIGQPIIHLDVESDEAVVAGQQIVDLRAQGRFEDSAFDLEEFVAEQPSRAGAESAAGRLRVAGRYDLNDQAYTATVNVSSWRIDSTDDVPVSGVVDLEYAGQGRGTTVFGKARLASNLTVSQDIALGEIVADVDLQGDHAILSAQAPEFNAAADGTVRLDPPYQASIRVNTQALDLARAVRDLELPVSLEGTSDIGLEAEGPIQQWQDGRASLEMTALDGRVQTLPVALREPLRARYEDGRLVLERLEGTLGKTSLSAAGALPVESAPSAGNVSEEDALLATLTGDLYDVAVAAAVAANVTDSSPQAPIAEGNGPLVLLARITGSLQAPAYAADLELGPGMVRARADLAPVENLHVRAHLENDLLELRSVSGRYHGADVRATGQAPLAVLTGSASAPDDGEIVLQATAVGVTSAVLAPFVDASTIAQVAGSLDARLDLSSTSLNLDDVQGEVVLERLNLTVADLPVTQRAPTKIIADSGIARIETWAWESEGTSIEVGGQVQLADQQAAILATGRLDARLLTPFLAGASTAGQVATRLSITGPLTEPTINGDVRLTDGELRLREPRIVAGDLDAVAVLARGNVFISSLTGTVNGGALTGSGQVQYTPDLRGQFTADVTGMAMNFPDGLRTEVDSSLALEAAVEEGEAANRLSGVITIRRGAYREPLALLTGLLNNLQRSGTATGSPPSPFLQSLALDVRVITDEDLVIDNNVADAQLGADLRLINVASSPALSGRAELREGGQLFLGRNTYVIESGAIDFANPSVIEPSLGIVATTRVSGVDVEVRITGTPDTLMTELTSPSDPDLGQADLTSLLLTGRPLGQLGAAQAAEVGAQVLGTLGGDVLGLAGRAVGLDTLRVVADTNPRDPADLASETDPTSRVTFGKSLGAKLDVTLSQSLVESSAQTWIVDYLPVRRIALRFVSDDDDLRSYVFRHQLTFGTAPVAIRSGDASREARQGRVGSVGFMGNLVFPEPEVRRQLRLTEGDRFDFIDWQEDRDRLERFYHGRQHLAARITARREEAGVQVDLTYTVEGGPETHIRVNGVALPGGVIEELESAWAQSVFEGFLIEEAEAIVRRELARQAAFQPMVNVAVEGDESVRTLVIDVTPSPRAERIEVRFEGVDEQLRSDLLDQVGGRQHALEALTNPGEYERTVLAALRAAGYPQSSATVGLPIFEETIAAIPVTVKPGPQFRYGMVRFAGATTLATADLQAEADLQPAAVYRAADVEAARTRLQSLYRREGFTTASLTAREDFRTDAREVDVAFEVTEGPRQVVEEILVFGARSVDEDVVRRTLRLNVGDSLRTADWLEARRRLFESGLFRRVDIAIEPLEGAAGSAQVRLRVNVEEWPALRLRYGFQVAEDRPEENVEGRDLVPGISADVTRRTLFGRAITVGGAAQYERLERLGRIFVSTPTMFGRQVQSSLILERSREENRVDTLVTNRTTAAWEQRGRWGRMTLSYGLRFERNRTFDTQPLDPVFPLDLTVHIGRLTSGVTWDSRDDPSDTTRGMFVSTSLEHSTSRLGSDLFFVRSLTQAYHFVPWKAVVLASAARYGAVQPLDDQALVSSLRFFAGGARTVRGVPEDSLGGLDFLGNPIGGRGLLTLNQEMRFPVYRWLRGVVFLDAGNVFPLVSDVRINELVGSTGVGLRLVTPFALFRIDYGRTIWNRPAPDSGRVVFGIGQTF